MNTQDKIKELESERKIILSEKRTHAEWIAMMTGRLEKISGEVLMLKDTDGK